MQKYEVEIFYLPPYSPEYNPVEQVWKWIKPLVNGITTFKNGITELLSRFRKICWHWHSGRIQNHIKIGVGIWETCYSYL